MEKRSAADSYSGLAWSSSASCPPSRFDLSLHVADFVEDREAFFKDASAGEAQSLLRQVADAHAAGLLHGAVVQRLETGKHLHQGGFAGAISAHKRGFLPGPDQPVGLKKQYARPKPLARILQ